MTDIQLFKSALRYIEKGYSYEDLSWGDDLYSATEDEKGIALDFYIEIKEKGTKWAYEYLKILEA